MDIATVMGIVAFLGMAFATILHSEGWAGFVPFANLEAFLIVMGGTFCATLVNFPLRQVIGVGKVIRNALFEAPEDAAKMVGIFVQLSKKAKQEGFLALQADADALDEDFVKRGLQLVIDGADQEFIRNMLDTEIGFIKERHNVGQEVLHSLGTYAPVFGIVGTVLGMILMLNSISDVEAVPRRMALCLAAAFYGMGFGYMVFVPMAGKLKRRSEEELFVKEIAIRGILLLQSGSAPSVVESNLKAYLGPADRVKVRTGDETPEGEAAEGAPAEGGAEAPPEEPPAGDA
jgi:chemotaxis protein MotA